MEGSIRSSGRAEVVPERPPLAYPAALRALAGCVAGTARLLRQRQLHLPKERVGMRLRFADGTSARVYRETAVDRGATLDPCVLAVEFRLRAVRGRGHAGLGPLPGPVHVHRLASAPGRGLTAVRPDGYIGFRGQAAEAGQLAAWLALTGAGPR